MTAAPKLTTRPGSLLSWLIHRVTGETGRTGCGCDRRRRAMDRWGWSGCWRRRHQIIVWVVHEARRRGHAVDEGQVASLLQAALFELRQRKAAGPTANSASDAEQPSSPGSAASAVVPTASARRHQAAPRRISRRRVR